MRLDGKGAGGERVRVYVWLRPCTAHLKLSQYCLLIGYTPEENKRLKKNRVNCGILGEARGQGAAGMERCGEGVTGKTAATLQRTDVLTCDSHRSEKGPSTFNNPKSQESADVSNIRIMAELFLYSVS